MAPHDHNGASREGRAACSTELRWSCDGPPGRTDMETHAADRSSFRGRLLVPG